MKNILITGGCGFIASNFINYFLERHQQYKIINIDAMYYCASHKHILPEVQTSGRYIFTEGNICDSNLVSHILNSRNITHIIHFAAHSQDYIDVLGEAGILLSNSEFENGILTESEIESLSIDNSLVFLSSCSSSKGEYIPGEGISSLANAFLNSGAKTVIASLWPIYDRSASELVNIFYENYS